MVKEPSPDSLSRVIGNSQARFLEGEDTATYSSLLDKKYGQMKSILFFQFKQPPLVPPIRGDAKGRGVWQLYLPKLGLISINLHRAIPDGFVVKQIRILKKANGRMSPV